MKSDKVTLAVMMPLGVGDTADPNGATSAPLWKTQEQQLAETVKLGGKLVGKKRLAASLDFWWGLIEAEEGVFDFRYYDKFVDMITASGAKVVAILSLHQCGGNVGDDRSFLVPKWLWKRLAEKLGVSDEDVAKYVSEQGSVNAEFVSVWASHLALEYFERFFRAFRDHYADRKDDFIEVNVSLGPAGELRFPSYNRPDKGVDWPNRGALQCYSRLARESFRDFVFNRHGDEDGIEKAWGARYSRDQINPPSSAPAFFRQGHQHSAYGKDLFDWYSDSLIEHGRRIMLKAIEVFDEEGSAFAGIDLGAKIPGLHWRLGDWKDEQIVLSDRLAELPAGLIRTSGNDWNSDEDGRGYRPLITLFADLDKGRSAGRVVLHFTCLEMNDGGDGKTADHSLAMSLVTWVGAEAKRQGVTIKGENALGWKLPYKECWQRMASHLAFDGSDGVYEGLTLLRMADVLAGETPRTAFKELCELAAGDDDSSSSEEGVVAQSPVAAAQAV